LLEIVKGVFGLATSPRLWWSKMSRQLLQMVFTDAYGEDISFVHHRIDPCLFLLRDSRGQLVATLCTHVDDLKYGGNKNYDHVARKIRDTFPIGDWEHLPYTYTGSQYRRDGEDIMLGQETYVDGRLEDMPVKRGKDDEEACNDEEMQDNMSAIGGISWLAGQSRPDLACGCSFAQKKQKSPTGKDLKHTAKLIKNAKKYKDTEIRISKLDVSNLCLVAFHDAAWANTTTGEHVDEPSDGQIADKEVYSQLGYLIYLCDKAVLTGQAAKGILVDWRSLTCPRVCRSTFASETMSCAEAMEAATALRGHLLEILHDDLDLRDIDPKLLPIVSVTDCKSLYDTVHKDGATKAPAEKRLILDLAALREMYKKEQQSAEPLLAGTMPLRWIPTAYMLADPLTKVMESEAMRQSMTTGWVRIGAG
jgi:hypothetical protein